MKELTKKIIFGGATTFVFVSALNASKPSEDKICWWDGSQMIVGVITSTATAVSIVAKLIYLLVSPNEAPPMTML